MNKKSIILRTTLLILIAVSIMPPLYGTKIVGLVPGRNEATFLAQHLRALSLFVDAIVYLDDASEDNSVAIAESIAAECKIEKIIKKDVWYRDEPGDRNRLLLEGRAIGGTHFIVLDMDEMITSNSLNNNYLRNQILSLEPGDRLHLLLIQLWRSISQFRTDEGPYTWVYTGFIFCDDAKCYYESDFLHTSRIPNNLNGRIRTLKRYDKDYIHGIMHFQFVNRRNLLIKQAWYRCLEHIRNPEKTIATINAIYAESKKENNLKLTPAPKSWFSNYKFFNPTIYDKPELWREIQILSWFATYGKDFFKELDIWDIDWGNDLPKNQ